MAMKQTQNRSNAWYRQPAMLVVAGVMFATLMSGVGMITAAMQIDDPLVMSEQEYREWKDDNRATEARQDAD